MPLIRNSVPNTMPILPFRNKVHSSNAIEREQRIKREDKRTLESLKAERRHCQNNRNNLNDNDGKNESQSIWIQRRSRAPEKVTQPINSTRSNIHTQEQTFKMMG
jgi:hypothetical protein